MTSKFYESPFWKEEDGLKLWQYRLLYTVLRYVYPDNKYIFITEARGYMDNKYEGLYAGYEVHENNSIAFSIEITGTELSFFGSDLDDEENTICFTMDNTDSDISNVPWSELETVLNSVKKWVEENIPVEEKHTLMSNMLNLTNHLK